MERSPFYHPSDKQEGASGSVDGASSTGGSHTSHRESSGGGLGRFPSVEGRDDDGFAIVTGWDDTAAPGGLLRGGSPPPQVATKLYISEAAMNDNLDEIKEGLVYALGTKESDPQWFPVPKQPPGLPSQAPHTQLEDTTSFQDSSSYIDNIPLDSLDPSGLLPRRHDRPLSFQRLSPHRPKLGKLHLSINTDLELGSYLSPALPTAGSSRLGDDLAPLTPSTKKLTNVFARLSERIAAKGQVGADDTNELGDSTTPMLTVPGSYFPELSTSTAPNGLGLFHGNGTGSQSQTELALSHSASGQSSPTPQSRTSSPLRLSPLKHSAAGDHGEGQFVPNVIVTAAASQSSLHDEAEASMQPDVASVHSTTTAGAATEYLFGKSLKVFGRDSHLRQMCFRALSHQQTNIVMLCLLFVQVALLSYRQWNPMHLGGYFYKGNNWADYVLMAINAAYTVEVGAKIVAYGLIDDRVMYEECGLEYPHSIIRWRWAWNNLVRVMKFLHLKQDRYMSGSTPVMGLRQRFQYRNPNVGSELDVKEIDLGESRATPNPFDTTAEEIVDLRKKHHFSLNHHFTPHKGQDHLNNEVDEESDGSIGNADPEEKPKTAADRDIFHSNTLFFNPPRQTQVDKLQLKRAFLKTLWHRIDFISMVAFWISLLLSINRYDVKHSVFIFRALSCLRILRLCNLTTGTSTILSAVKLALPQLLDVSLFILCFWIFFGIIGVQSFKSSLTRQCVWTNPNNASEQYVNSEQYCGSYLNISNSNPMPYILRDGLSSRIIKGFTCPVNSQCVAGQNPYGGTVNFDNIFQSMELVFVVMSANTFTDIMYYTTDSENLAASLFFICAIFVLTVWLINIFIAVIVKSFNTTRMEQQRQRMESGKPHFPMFESMPLTDRAHAVRNQNVLLRYYYKSEFVWVILIALDLFTQCFRNYDMSELGHHTLYRFECAFTGVFLGEIILRIALHFPNWRLFAVSRRNWFDLFLAIITSIIVLGPVKSQLGQAYYWLTAFQIMRFYRVVLSTRFTRNLWLTIMRNFRAIFDLALFYFILLFLTSIVAARYFEGTIPEDEIEEIDFPMHTLPNVFIAMYVITSTENWTEIMYPLQQYARNVSSSCFGAMILIGWFMVSNSVILNIFIAVIAQTLEVSESGKRKQQLLQFIDNMTARLQNIDTSNGLLSKFKNRMFKNRGVKEDLEKAVINLLLSGTAVKDFLDDENGDADIDDDDVRDLPKNKFNRWLKVNLVRTNNVLRNPFFAKTKMKHEVSNFDPADFARKIINDRNKLINKQNKFLQQNPKFNSVFFVISPQHRIRRACQRIVRSSYGERIDGVEPNNLVLDAFVAVMFLATMVLVVTACYMTPLYRNELTENHGTWNWAAYLEVAFTIFFTLEFLVKILADGLIFTPNAYMRSPWNLIDLLVLIALWIELIAFLKNDGDLSRIVRGLKALRALRLLTISKTAKDNFHNTLISGFGKIVSAAIISLCLLFPFSIWGLNIFNGRLGYCLDGESDVHLCFNEYENQVFNWNIMLPNVYTEPQLQFNKWTTLFATLFEIVSLEGWTDLLLDVMKLTGIGTPPEDYASPFNGFFVMLFNFISTIFILTLFVSVVIVNYSKTTGRAYMTSDQISWYEVRKILIQVKASKRKVSGEMNWVRRFCYKLTVEKKNIYWRVYLNVVLVAHVVALLLETFPSYDWVESLRSAIFMIASVSFSINVCMLMIAQGIRTFMRYKWNVFYAFISWGAFVCTLIGLFRGQRSAFVNINKLFLVGILAFIIPRSNRLSQLLRFASASLPTLLSLSFTWAVVFLVFAIALNQIFGYTKIGPNGTGNLNLRSVPKALVVLFRCSFGEGWNYIMEDYTLEEPFCTILENGISDCGNKQYAYILFVCWNLMSMYIFLNMFVSLILDSFSYINNRSSYIKLIQRDEIRKFKRAWQRFDPEGTGYIKPSDLPTLLHSLDGALSFHFYTGALEIKALCKAWFIRNNPFDPYDITVRHEAIEDTFKSMDVAKIRHRRHVYERFVEEALLSMELNGDPGISFTRLLLQLPLYIAFEAGLCLNLIDFLERRLLLQKVDRRIKIQRVYDTMTTYAVRWKYVKDRKHGIRNSDIDFGKELRRYSYLDAASKAPSIFVTDENETQHSPHDSPHHKNPPVASHRVSRNPFDQDPSDQANPLFFEDVDMFDTDNMYVPKTPVHIYKSSEMRDHVLSPGKITNTASNDAATQSSDAPQLFIKIPSDPSGSAAHSSNYTGITTPKLSPREDIVITGGAEHENDRSKASFIDISTIGEHLENTEWSEALKQVQTDQEEERDRDL